MTELGERLAQLAAEACSYPPGHVKRQHALTQIVRLVKPKLWQDSTPHYADALQRTWIYFCQNICDGQTGRCYDPERGSIVTWLNAYLKRRLQDCAIEDIEHRHRFVSDRLRDDDRSPQAAIDRVAAPQDVPPMLGRVEAWVREDASGDLRQTHLKHRPDITCQLLILRRLPPEVAWKDLEAELYVTISTLSSFYQRQCLPRLRAFGMSEGFL